MADTTVHIGENSPEYIAYRLMQDIANVEKRELFGHGDNPADRAYILKAYHDCLNVVRGGVHRD